MNSFFDTVRYFLFITAELSILFVGISAAVALALMYIPQEKLRGWLSVQGLKGNFLGALVGSLTPFCACSTIPMTLGLLNAGAPFGPVMSFVIASPLLNPIIIVMIGTLLGFKACALYFVITFLGSVLFGVTIEKTGGANFVKKVRLKTGCCSSNPSENLEPESFAGKLESAFSSAWWDFMAVLKFLLIGVAVGALIYGYIPGDLVARVAGPGNPFAIPVAAVIGVPLYIRAETAIPIGLSLAEKGMSLGAVIALIIGGAGMAIPEMVMLAGIFRKRLVGAIVAAIWFTAVFGGYFFNALT